VRSLIPAVVVLLGAPGVAGAAVTPGEYGGGSFQPPVKANFVGLGSSFMSADVGANGRAEVAGTISVPCGLIFFSAQVTPAADGTFRFTRTRSGRGLRSVTTVQGRFDGTTASGTLRGRLRVKAPNGKVRRCSTKGDKSWQLRLPAAAGAPAAAQPGAPYYGLTSQAGRVLRPFLLHVSPDGAQIVSAKFEYSRKCERRSFELNDVVPPIAIQPDGAFSARERFTLRYRDVRQVERFSVAVDGRFSTTGVHGTLRVTTEIRRPGRKRVIDRCETGPLTFAASL
jgi:hypothetical protein